MSASEWGYMTLRFCDQGRTAHLLIAGGEPACGAQHYASCGSPSLNVPDEQKCRNCLRIEASRRARVTCNWQVAYGLPHTETCNKPAGPSGRCREHDRALKANYPQHTRST